MFIFEPILLGIPCSMKNLSYLIPIFTFLLFVQCSKAQRFFTEVGMGIGNVVKEQHTLGKAEIYFNLLTPVKFGQLGLDFSTGGNFIPGTRSMIEGDTEILSPNDARFSTVSALYRLPIKELFFFESHLGYSSISYYVHTDTEDRIQQPNLTYALGIGATLSGRLTVSLRYQHFGVAPEYEGVKDMTTLKSNAEEVMIMLFRMSYRFSWDNLFKKYT